MVTKVIYELKSALGLRFFQKLDPDSGKILITLTPIVFPLLKNTIGLNFF